MKILFVVLGILGLAGGSPSVGLVRRSQSQEAAANNGIDLNSFSETRRDPPGDFDACSCSPRKTCPQILNLNVERAKATAVHSFHLSLFLFRGTTARSRRSSRSQEETRRRDESWEPKADQSVVIKRLWHYGSRALPGAAGPFVGETNGLLLTIGVDSENAKAAMAGFQARDGPDWRHRNERCRSGR